MHDPTTGEPVGLPAQVATAADIAALRQELTEAAAADRATAIAALREELTAAAAADRAAAIATLREELRSDATADRAAAAGADAELNATLQQAITAAAAVEASVTADGDATVVADYRRDYVVPRADCSIPAAGWAYQYDPVGVRANAPEG